MIFSLFFFFIYTFISKLNCLYYNEIKEVNLDSNNYIYNYNFNDMIIHKNLSVGKVHEELLYYSNEYIFNFHKSDNKNASLYFHFYPLDDCHIKISSNNTSVKIEKKRNYNNNLFYAQINLEKVLYSISFKIEPINYLNQDRNSTCHLSLYGLNYHMGKNKSIKINNK